MTAIVLDTETTGLDAPDVISLATSELLPAPDTNLVSARCVLRSFKPRKPISYAAMATHHIIPEDVEFAEEWPGSWPTPPGVEYLVGHNVDYDWKAIGSPHVARICTLALSRWIWPDLESHSLGALIYFLMPPPEARKLLQRAHAADQDVYLCLLVLQHILYARPLVSWHQVWAASEKARVPTRFAFGKYGPKDGKPGQLIADVRRQDPGYIRWCLGVPDFANDSYLAKALRGEAA